MRRWLSRLEDVWYQRASVPVPVEAVLAAGERAWTLATRTATARCSSSPAALPTIGISSPTVGGSGKTPLTRWVAEQVHRLGYPVAVITRGHGGRSRGPIRVDPRAHGAGDVGDEPLWLAGELPAVPVIVSRNRSEGIDLAMRHGMRVAVLDDAIMTRSIAVDLEFMVLGAAGWIGNGRCLPAGPLRVHAETVRRADALVVIDESGAHPSWRVRADALAAGVPMAVARMAPVGIRGPDGIRREPAWARERPTVAWAGIARPWRFRYMLEEMGVDIRSFVSFPDHHVYSRRDLERLARLAERRDGIPLTTAKDRARWPAWACWTPYFSEVEFRLDDPAGRCLLELIKGVLNG